MLPDGLVVDTPWLDRHGYRRQWREKYLEHGWLERVVHGVYSRPSSSGELVIPWQRVVVSIQMLLEKAVHIGGKTALGLHGLSHYLQLSGRITVHLYTYDPLPGWIRRIPCDGELVTHKAQRLFVADAPGVTRVEWGHLGWNLELSTPERALCELLNELPERESFHHVDVLMDAARTLSPTKVQAMLETCTSKKVKRLFLWFAERHEHAWLNHLDLSRIDLGRGKRQIVAGGRFDPKYQITVPVVIDAGG